MPLVHTLSFLRREQRNEVVVELGKGLEMGQYEISKYIPQYLGEAALGDQKGLLPYRFPVVGQALEQQAQQLLPWTT